MGDNKNIQEVKTYLLDVFVTVVIFALSLFAAIKFQEVDNPSSSLLILNPAVFLLTGACAVRSVVMLFGLRKKSAELAVIRQETKENFSSLNAALKTILTPAVRFGICVFIYVALMYAKLIKSTLYFYLVSFVFLVAVPYVVTGKKQKLSFVKWTLICAAVTVGLYVVFNNILKIYFYF